MNKDLKLEVDTDSEWLIFVDDEGECWGGAIIYADNTNGPKEGKFPASWSEEEIDNEFLGKVFPTEDGEYRSKNGYHITMYS